MTTPIKFYYLYFNRDEGRVIIRPNSISQWVDYNKIEQGVLEYLPQLLNGKYLLKIGQTFSPEPGFDWFYINKNKAQKLLNKFYDPNTQHLLALQLL